MLITSQSNHKLHTTAPLFPRCLTFTFSPLNHQQPLSSFIIEWRHVPLISLVAFQEFRKAEFFGVLCWCFPQRKTRKLSTLLRLCFDHWCSQHLSLSHLRFAARPTWLGLVALGRFFSRPMNPWSDSVLLWNAFVKFWVWFHETLNAWSVWDFGSPRHSSCWMMLEKTIFVDAWPFG